MSNLKPHTSPCASQDVNRLNGLEFEEFDDELDSGSREQKYSLNAESLDNCVAMSEKLRASDASNRQLSTEIREMSQKSRILTEELKVAQEKIRQLEAKILEKETPLAQLRATLAEATEKTKSEEFSRLESVIEKKEKEAKSLTAEKETLKQQLDHTRQNLATMQQKSAKLSQKYATLKDRNADSEVKVQRLEQKMTEFEAKIVGLELGAVEKSQQIETKETLIRKLQCELEKSKRDTAEAVNAHRSAYRLLADILPKLAPAGPVSRNTEELPVPEAMIGPSHKLIVDTPIPQINIPPIPLLQSRKRRHLQKESHPQRRYNLRTRQLPEPRPELNVGTLRLCRSKSMQ
ncbi:hypothetical protein Ddc_18618 [Ditylenchus destructor]|nr:hypothetical protein Ddc_18618 [Ditylenchus destructor]